MLVALNFSIEFLLRALLLFFFFCFSQTTISLNLVQLTKCHFYVKFNFHFLRSIKSQTFLCFYHIKSTSNRSHNANYDQQTDLTKKNFKEKIGLNIHKI